MKFQNATNKKMFLQSYERGRYKIKLLKTKEDGTKVYQIVYDDFEELTLYKNGMFCKLIYHGIRGVTDSCIIYFSMEENTIIIEKATEKGRNYKSQRYLKKFVEPCLFASCFIKFGLCD